MRREKKKKGERESREISVLSKILPVQLKKKQLRQRHCRKRKKKIVLAIVAMPLPKMEKKIMKSVNE